MLKIRLARIGKKKKPTYRFIVNEAGRDTYGKALEILGSYNPFSKVCDVKKDRILYWISQGAQASPTVHNLLIDQNVITGDKVKASKGGKKKDAENTESKTEVKSDAENAEFKVENKPAEIAEAKAEEKAEAKPEEKPAEPAA